MAMGIDEARRHHVIRGVDGLFTGDRVRRDHGDLAVLDTDVQLLVQHRRNATR